MKHPSKSRFWFRSLGAIAAVWGASAFLLAADPSTAPEPTSSAAPNKFIGAAKCKTCHDSDEMGNQYGAWESAGHSKAFDALASDEAKAIAKERGIDDPQKADACVKCHVTAFGVDKKLIKRGFKMEAGVQCESCHGPGDQHFKARFAAAAAEEADPKVEPGEIITSPGQEVCRACHNSESPTFEKFCFYERVEQVRHSRPRTDEQKAAELVCGCGDPCPCVDNCPDDGCGVPRGTLGK